MIMIRIVPSRCGPQWLTQHVDTVSAIELVDGQLVDARRFIV